MKQVALLLALLLLWSGVTIASAERGGERWSWDYMTPCEECCDSCSGAQCHRCPCDCGIIPEEPLESRIDDAITVPLEHAFNGSIVKVGVNVYNGTNARGNPVEALPYDNTTFEFYVRWVDNGTFAVLGLYNASQDGRGYFPMTYGKPHGDAYYQIEVVDLPDGYCAFGDGKYEVKSSAVVLKFYRCGEEKPSWDVIKPFGNAWGLMKKWVDNFVKMTGGKKTWISS